MVAVEVRFGSITWYTLILGPHVPRSLDNANLINLSRHRLDLDLTRDTGVSNFGVFSSFTFWFFLDLWNMPTTARWLFAMYDEYRANWRGEGTRFTSRPDMAPIQPQACAPKNKAKKITWINESYELYDSTTLRRDVTYYSADLSTRCKWIRLKTSRMITGHSQLWVKPSLYLIVNRVVHQIFIPKVDSRQASSLSVIWTLSQSAVHGDLGNFTISPVNSGGEFVIYKSPSLPILLPCFLFSSIFQQAVFIPFYLLPPIYRRAPLLPCTALELSPLIPIIFLYIAHI